MEFDVLCEVIARVLSVDVKEITLDTTFVGDLGADSLDVFLIITGVENRLEITIPVEQVEQVSCVRDAVELIKRAGK